MAMADRTFIYATSGIKKMASKIPIRGLGSKIHYSDEFVVLTFYKKGVLSFDTRAFAKITREIHIVDNLKADMLIGADNLTPERMMIDFATQTITIDSCRSMAVPMNSRARSEPTKRIIKSSSRVVLPPRSTQTIQIAFAGELLSDRDLLFEPRCSLQLGQTEDIYAHVVDSSFQTVHVRNDTNKHVIIPPKERLGTLEEYDQDEYFSIGADHAQPLSCSS